MAIDLDDEIVQDFLVEAGEILEKLNAQLVELEQSPDDYDLLNAIFRGFHTIKGGAGFLNLTALVDVCHRAEDVFNALRQGERRVDPALMDVILEVLDVVNTMFRDIRSGHDPEPADPSLINKLKALAQPQSEADPVANGKVPASTGAKAAPSPSSVVEQALAAMLEPAPTDDPPGPDFQSLSDPSLARSKVGTTSPDSDEITEEEFERLLDELHGKGRHGGVPKAALPKAPNTEPEDEITEEEFERLLDELHGKDKHSGVPGNAIPDAPTSAVESDHITEEEFERLLDQLHGKGRHGGVPKQAITHSPAIPSVPEDTRGTPKKLAEPTKALHAPAVETTVRVDTQRLDEIMNMVGELVLVRNRFKTLKSALNDEEIAKAVANLDVVTSDLQLSVMKTRMQPIKKVFGRFPRVVRDLARSLNKEVRLELRGEETDLDKNLVEALADPLVHLVRNAVDHGIETPEERTAAGKPREGLIVLTASQEGNHIELTIEDDGKGMDPEVLRRKAVEKGLMDAESAARLDDKDCYNLVFMPGFSTKSEISDVSGRGVGMDVVKTRIAQMSGSVAIDSVKGKGSRITIKLPLTLAIMPTLMVKLNDQPFALPLANVVEILDLDLKKSNTVDGQLVVLVRQRALPLFYLKEWLIPGYRHDRSRKESSGHVVVVNVGGRHVGFVVDHLVGQEEVVIKPLGAKLRNVSGMAGATITGDGKIALILDVPGLMKRYASLH
ncbi:chemotaxis protein CheA [Methylocaldum szegediense]|uniref:histidine kinase n=1 Tax=Methylocaldum szegediense TaxID=73780 RepID=A0ABM9I6X4_9GAMM|nr:chemotaxis protein CheA [Methylocaldum szegediense]CAI8931784.1 two-component system, chemotaxis family, sensor kinase CheA [Methylocaldum szegediense]